MRKNKIEFDADENIIFSVRRHWFVHAVEIFVLVILAFIPLFFYVISAVLFTETPYSPASYIPYFITFYAVWLIILWMALFNLWTNYYLDVWTLTNKRFVTVDQQGFFYRKISSFRLDRLQDVNVSIHGLIATFLNFGTVEIQTASEDGTFKMVNVSNPEAIKAMILSASGESHTLTQNTDGKGL